MVLEVNTLYGESKVLQNFGNVKKKSDFTRDFAAVLKVMNYKGL